MRMGFVSGTALRPSNVPKLLVPKSCGAIWDGCNAMNTRGQHQRQTKPPSLKEKGLSHPPRLSTFDSFGQ